MFGRLRPARKAAPAATFRKEDLSPPAGPWEELAAIIGEWPDDAETIPAMVFLGIPAELAARLAVTSTGAVEALPAEDLHITICCVQIEPGRLYQALEIVAATMATALEAYPFVARLTGAAIFEPAEDSDASPVAVQLVDSIGIEDLRVQVREALDWAGCGYAMNHGFLPHISVAVGPLDELRALPVPVVPEPERSWVVENIGVAVGDYVAHFPLAAGYLYRAVARASTEKQFTLSPMYAPGALDTHDEWTTVDELQGASWEWMRKSEREIMLQHMPGVVAGECVELVTWPFEVTCELSTGAGSVQKVTVPANTCWAGVIWNDWAWEMVKRGELNGLSMGGWAARVDGAPA